ncbi:MAG: hypothetical protein AB7T63_15345 [Planctomycetota bacterium]
MRDHVRALLVGGVAVLAFSACTSNECCKARSKAKEAAESAPEPLPGDPVIVVEGAPVYIQDAPVYVPAPAPAPVVSATTTKPTRRPSAALSRSGFQVFEDDGRIWVLRDGSEDLAEYLAVGEPAKSVTLIGVGPGGRTVRSSDKATIEAWLGAYGMVAGRSTAFGRPGFDVFERDGRLWVFASGSKDLEEFLAHGEPAKSVTLVGAGPEGRTLIGPSREVLDSYRTSIRYGAPGFAVFLDDGRLWVLREGTEDLEQYLSVGEPAKSVTLIGVGPEGQTVRAPDRETADAWLATIR